MLPLLVAIAIAVADQVTKEWVRATFALEQSRELIPGFFNFTYVRNTGAAWGMFGGQNLALSLLSMVMLGLLIVFRRQFLGDAPIHRWALGLLVGGIVGNLFDRIRLNFVVDFLDFHLAGYHWPAFNIADAAICTGVGLYILIVSRHPAPATKEAVAGNKT